MKNINNAIFLSPFLLMGFLLGCGVTPKSAAEDACGCASKVLTEDLEGDTDRDIRVKLRECTKKSKEFRETFSVDKKQLQEYNEAVEQCVDVFRKDHGLRGSSPI